MMVEVKGAGLNEIELNIVALNERLVKRGLKQVIVDVNLDWVACVLG